jgi:ABC-2 type transport system permease protein
VSSRPDAPDARDARDAEAPRSAVIHDLGYRPYEGPRLGEPAVARALFLTGLRNSYGLGRSARSKVFPMILLGLMLLPALILVGVLVQARTLLGLTEQIVPYSTYPLTTQLLISVFVAAQAPALFSRDLRFGTITLYLARPMRRSTYVLMRWGSLAAATLVLVGAPLLLLYLGGVLAGLPLGRETLRTLGALVGAVLLAACLAGLGALVASLTIRRGLAVAAIIVVLLVSYTVVSAVQGIALDSGHGQVGVVAGLFSPYTLVQGVEVLLFDAPRATPTPPSGFGDGVLYLVVTAAVVAGSVGALLARYRRVRT